MFLTSRRKIREVEVEVINPGDVDGFARFPDPWTEVRQEPAAGERSALPMRAYAEANGGQAPVALLEAERTDFRPSREALPTPLPREAVEAEQVAKPIDAAEVPDLIDILDPEPADVDEAVLAPQPTELMCEIVFWRGYRKSAFYARIFDEAGEPLAVAESRFFRSSGNGTPDANDEAETAYDDLCERLERDGWRWVDQGLTWYGDVFERDVTADAESESESE